ncbi:hypothetical protein Tco_1280886 [Tanacetum coccineum]
MGDENHISTLGYYSKPRHEGYRNIIELPEGNNVVPLRSDTIVLVQNGCSFHELQFEDPNQHLKDFLKLVDSLDLDVANRERTRIRLFQFSLRDQASNWLERLPAGSISTCIDSFQGLTQKSPSSWHQSLAPKDLALYDNEIWNDPKDFAKPVKAISLPQDVPSISDRHLIELENHVQRLMEAHLAPKQPVQVNKITSLCEICSGPTTLSTACKIPSKLSSSMHPRATMKLEENEVREEENVKPNATKYNDHEMTAKAEEKVEEESEDEFKEEVEEEEEEE